MRIFILNFLMGFFSSEFLSRSFFSSDDTEFIRRFPAETITHGFSQMRPVRSLQIPPESGKSPTDFADDADFFSWDFIHRMTRNLFGEFLLRRLLTDFRRCDLSGRCRYPLRLDKEIHQRFHRKSVYICEICGTKPSHEEKSAPSAKSA
jgi:hypothetical protein